MTSVVDIYPEDTIATIKEKIKEMYCKIVLHGEISPSKINAISCKKSKHIELVDTLPKDFVMHMISIGHKFASITVNIPDINKCVLDFGHRASNDCIRLASKTPVAVKLINAPLLMRITIRSAITLCIENCISLLDITSESDYARLYLLGTNSIRKMRIIGSYELVDVGKENVSNQLYTFPFYKCPSFKSISVSQIPRLGACTDYDSVTFELNWGDKKNLDYSGMEPIDHIATLRINDSLIIPPHINSVDLLILPFMAIGASTENIKCINRIQLLLHSKPKPDWRAAIHNVVSFDEIVHIVGKCQNAFIAFEGHPKATIPIPFEEFMADYEEKYGESSCAKSARKI